MRMNKSIINFLKKHHLLWLSSLGLFIAMWFGYMVYLYFGATPTSYIYGVTAFAGVSLLIYFDWGYHEDDHAAFGNYTGIIIVYAIISAVLTITAFMYLSALAGYATFVICALIGVYLTVPIIRFLQANGWL